MKTEGISNVVKKPTDLKWPQLCTTCDLKSHDDVLTLLYTQEAISHSSHIRAEGDFLWTGHGIVFTGTWTLRGLCDLSPRV